MKEILLSPVLFVIILFFGFLFPKSKKIRKLAILGVVLFLCTSIPVTSALMLRVLESRVSSLSLQDPTLAEKADAIVVLGGGRYASAPEFDNKSTVSISSLERVRYAALLARATKKPVLVSGGSPKWAGDSEALLMKQSLERDFLVPVEWLEAQSNNTRENALYTSKILLPKGIHRIFLVTHAAHMSRAKRSFENLGFTVVPAPLGFASYSIGHDVEDLIPTVKGMELSRMAAHEYIGEIWYWIHRKITGI